MPSNTVPEPVAGQSQGQGQNQSQGQALDGGLTRAYRPTGTGYDEFIGADGQPREAWRGFAQRLDSLGAGGLSINWKRGEDLLRENGISYNLLADSASSHRPWSLDPIPVILSETEWEPLERGLIQRAHLWNAILKDCYGPRTLLEKGLIPASLLLSQSNYNRSLPRMGDSGQPLLTFYAADVARDPDGSWVVVADRTEAPNGTGFALENRIALSNVFPETAHRLHLVRVASFFQQMRDSLFARIPSAVDSPCVVLFSPGSNDRTYFEDAYLARYLGIPLAVGDELTVRNDRLYLKTVAGLNRVHVLFRRVDETESDPLELPAGSNQGIPGLMQAVRKGNVVVLNPPGTGITEAPAFLPSLSAIARELLGQDLAIPSIETVWGGQNPDLLNALDCPAMLKAAMGPRNTPPVRLKDLPPEKVEHYRQLVARHPETYVVQREMPYSTAPVWNGSALESRRVAFRIFLFNDGKNYHVMPGGLIRCAASTNSLPGLSLTHESASKDLWILADQTRNTNYTSNLPSFQPIRRTVGSLSSRAADNLFWLGRYAERSENAVRILQEITNLAAPEEDLRNLQALPILLSTLAHFSYLPPEMAKAGTAVPDRKKLLPLLLPVFFGNSPSEPLDSLPQNLTRLRGIASLSRDRLSGESWRIIGQLHSQIYATPPKSYAAFRSILQQALTIHAAFNGTCRENLTRNQGWQFLNMGRKVERTTWLLHFATELLTLPHPIPSTVLETALAFNDTTLTYRFRYQGPPQPLPALDLILFEPTNPRSLVFQLAEIDQNLRDLSRRDPSALPRVSHRVILRALHALQTEMLDTYQSGEEEQAIARLRTFLDQLLKDLPEFAEQLGYEFFTHADFTRS